MRGRSGGWNDDSRNSGTMLYPICQSQIPQSDINGRHMWGNGMSSSFNVRVCVEADDYLFFQDDRMWIREYSNGRLGLDSDGSPVRTDRATGRHPE